jgi:hypothetical protein
MIKQAAVCMSPLFGADAAAMADDVMDESCELAADVCEKLGSGRERCRATWLSLLNIQRRLRWTGRQGKEGKMQMKRRSL